MLFSADLVDESRRKKALSGELTPFDADLNNCVFQFTGSEGEIYTTTLDECTCTDFSLNLGRQRPCKHMIRAAMELGFFPNEGVVKDPEAASIRYYLGILRTYIHDAPLTNAVKAQQIIDSAGEAKTSIEDNALSFAGVPSLIGSGLFTVKGKKEKLVPSKAAKSGLEGLKRTLVIRLGYLIYDNLSCEPIKNLIDNISIFQGAVSK